MSNVSFPFLNYPQCTYINKFINYIHIQSKHVIDQQLPKKSSISQNKTLTFEQLKIPKHIKLTMFSMLRDCEHLLD